MVVRLKILNTCQLGHRCFEISLVMKPGDWATQMLLLMRRRQGNSIQAGVVRDVLTKK